jgi:hypothetical protein
MAEQIPNGDAPISADVEMKEESVAEVWQHGNHTSILNAAIDNTFSPRSAPFNQPSPTTPLRHR